MKRIVLAITILSLIVFASSAMAQVGATSSDSSAPLAELGPVVGKTVSAYSVSGTAFGVRTTPTTVVSTPVPSKYKSQSQWLVAHVSLQQRCPGNYITGSASVDGIAMYPTETGSFYFLCYDNAGYEARHITYFLPPQSLGGPAITPGSTVSVWVQSGNGTPEIAFRSILVQAVK